MKTLIIMFAVGLMIQQTTQAQGTMTYLSNLDEPSTGNDSVGSDSWLAANFITGYNTEGYLLDSVQLAMADATGNPSGFTVMLYTSSPLGSPAIFPENSLDALNGSDNPSTAGIYTYTPDTDITLLPNMNYFIVVTAGTVVANGAYEWGVTSTSSGYNSYHWAGGVIPLTQSSNGSTWNYSNVYPLFAITATAVPEPSPAMLLLLGSGVFIYVRRTFKR